MLHIEVNDHQCYILKSMITCRVIIHLDASSQYRGIPRSHLGNGNEMFREHLCRFHGVSGRQDSHAYQYLNNSEYREKIVQQTISRENTTHKES
jgi:hypothetical protein